MKTIEVELVGGAVAELRPLVPEDAPLLAEGMAALSESSRFARFGIGIDHLSNQELRYLTEVDQRKHVAWGATIGGQAAGVGRYVLIDEQGCAEVAITVVDEHQRQGLGRYLFSALAAVARADGLESFCFEVAPSNTAVMRLLRGVAERSQVSGLVHGRAPLDQIPETDRDADFIALMESYRNGVILG